MQRVKNPPIPLKAFASIDSMREEINEVVAFLQNPRAFEQMGARAPRVCYSQNDAFFPYLFLFISLLNFLLKNGGQLTYHEWFKLDLILLP